MKLPEVAFFEDLQENLIDLQQELIKAVTYIYNLDNIKSLEKYTYSERFAVYLIKRMGKLYTYYENDFIIRDSYSRKYKDIGNSRSLCKLEKIKLTPNLRKNLKLGRKKLRKKLTI